MRGYREEEVGRARHRKPKSQRHRLSMEPPDFPSHFGAGGDPFLASIRKPFVKHVTLQKELLQMTRGLGAHEWDKKDGIGRRCVGRIRAHPRLPLRFPPPTQARSLYLLRVQFECVWAQMRG